MEKEAKINRVFSKKMRELRKRAESGMPLAFSRLDEELAEEIAPTLAETMAVMFVLMMMQDDRFERARVERSIRRPAEQWAARTAAAVADKFIAGIRRDLGAGKPPREVFDPDRGGWVGATEVTRAGTMGQQLARHMIGEADTTVAIWDATMDSRVCPICAALNGKTEEEWVLEYPAGPPAHPNCRCHLEYR
jgi:hypothetical protein